MLLMAAGAAVSSAKTIVVKPPPSSCCTTKWESNKCNVIQNAIKKAKKNTTIELQPGNYCNQNYFQNVNKEKPTHMRNNQIAKINNKKNLTIVGINDA